MQVVCILETRKNYSVSHYQHEKRSLEVLHKSPKNVWFFGVQFVKEAISELNLGFWVHFAVNIVFFSKKHDYVCGCGLHFLLCMQNTLVDLLRKYNVSKEKLEKNISNYKRYLFHSSPSFWFNRATGAVYQNANIFKWYTLYLL